MQSGVLDYLDSLNQEFAENQVEISITARSTVGPLISRSFTWTLRIR